LSLFFADLQREFFILSSLNELEGDILVQFRYIPHILNLGEMPMSNMSSDRTVGIAKSSPLNLFVVVKTVKFSLVMTVLIRLKK
jgi:hypothetical protein